MIEGFSRCQYDDELEVIIDGMITLGFCLEILDKIDLPTAKNCSAYIIESRSLLSPGYVVAYIDGRNGENRIEELRGKIRSVHVLKDPYAYNLAMDDGDSVRVNLARQFAEMVVGMRRPSIDYINVNFTLDPVVSPSGNSDV